MEKITKPLSSFVCWLLDWLVKKLIRSILKKTAAGQIDSRSYSWQVECVIRVRTLQFALQVKMKKTTAFSETKSHSEKALSRARDDPENAEREK